MGLTVIVGCHCSSLNSRTGYVYTGPLFSRSYCTTWLSQLYSGRAQPTLLFLFFPSLLVSRQWQCNDLYPTSIFILNPKGERNWYYWVTIPSHFHALHTKFSRQLCKTALLFSFLVRKHTLKGGKLAKVILLGRMYSSQDVLVVSCWGLLHPDTKGKEWVSKRLFNCPGMESDLGQTAQII